MGRVRPTGGCATKSGRGVRCTGQARCEAGRSCPRKTETGSPGTRSGSAKSRLTMVSTPACKRMGVGKPSLHEHQLVQRDRDAKCKSEWRGPRVQFRIGSGCPQRWPEVEGWQFVGVDVLRPVDEDTLLVCIGGRHLLCASRPTRSSRRRDASLNGAVPTICRRMLSGLPFDPWVTSARSKLSEPMQAARMPPLFSGYRSGLRLRCQGSHRSRIVCISWGQTSGKPGASPSPSLR